MKPKRLANRDDVIDELRFISNPTNNYFVGQRDNATRLRLAIQDCEFDPTALMKEVVGILDNHNPSIPTGLKKLKERKILMDNGGSMPKKAVK